MPMPDRLMRLPEVIQVIGKSKAFIYRQMGEGSFPRPRRLGANSVAWRASDISAWIETRPES